MPKPSPYDYLASLCARAEYCAHDLRQKLYRQGITGGEADRIIERLTDEGFVDEERYASAFVHDKLQFDLWGRTKISYTLKQHGIGESAIAAALDRHFDEEQYAANLRRVLDGKARSLRIDLDKTLGREDYARLVRHALARGYEYAYIIRCIGEGEYEE